MEVTTYVVGHGKVLSDWMTNAISPYLVIPACCDESGNK